MAKTKEQWDKISADVVAALGKVAKKHNVTFERNGFTYYDDKCAFKVLATVNDASGKKIDLPRMAYIKHAKQTWTLIKPGWLDKTFEDRGRKYTIIGYEPSRKFSVLTRRDDGSITSWTDEALADRMNGNKKAA